MSTPQQQRERRERLAREAGREVRAYSPRVKCKTDAERREWRLEQKRRYRAEAAEKTGRAFRARGPKVRHDAHVHVWVVWSAILVELMRPNPVLLQDAHVVRYLQCVRDRAKSKRMYRKHYEHHIEKRRRRTQDLPDSYIAEHLLKLPLDRCPLDLIEAKRTHLKFVRILREKRKQ